MLRVVLLLLLFVGRILPVQAQNQAPDYSILLIQNSFSDDGTQTIVKFDVLNSGGDSDKTSTATLHLISTGEQIATASIPPLVNNGRFTVVMQFANSRFGPSSVESFRATVGIGDIEQETSPTAHDNFARIVITFPSTLPQPQVTPPVEAPSGSAPTTTAVPNDTVQELLAKLDVDLRTPEQRLMLAGLIAVALILILIVTIIIRLVLSRTPDFRGWQPSYSNVLPVDPNSQVGRRQQWQNVAINSLLPSTDSEGSVQVRKLPTDVQTNYLSAWAFVALRLSQYDMYGRVSRSEIMADKKLINRLNWVNKKHTKLKPEQVKRQIQPVAHSLAHLVRKKVTDRTAILPLVLDLRLRGRHGDVRIWFELYRRQFGHWEPIDRWEPEMAVQDKFIYDTFTFTLYGQKPGEDIKRFQKRLEDDLAQMFVDVFNPLVVSIAPRADAPTDPHLMPVPSPPESTSR